MTDQMTQFFVKLRAAYRYSVDAHASQGSRRAEALHMPAVEFLQTLYEPRSVEAIIRDRIMSSSDTVAIVGPRHSGKTSTSIKIKQDIESGDHRAFVVFVDARNSEYMVRLLDSNNYENLERYLTLLVVEEYLSRLFDDSDTPTGNNRYKLYEFLLGEYDDNVRPRDIFNVLSLIREDARYKLRKMRSATGKSDVSMYDLMNEGLSSSNDAVRQLEVALRATIGVSHVVYAAHSILNIENQVLWMDNVDALPINLQPRALALLRRFHLQTSHCLSAIIAIREENVIRPDDHSDYGSPSGITKIMINSEAEQGTLIDAIDLVAAKSRRLDSIISRRLSYARAASGIDDETYDLIHRVSKPLNQAFRAAMAQHLANGSLREVFSAHAVCLRMLSTYVDDKGSDLHPKYLSLYHLLTLFYSWCANPSSAMSWISTYNIVTESRQWLSEGGKGVGCIPQYMIVNCVTNLQREGLRDAGYGVLRQSPSLRRILDRLEAVGYADSTVKSMIGILYDPDKTRRRALFGVRRHEDILLGVDLTDMHELYVTPRARTIISRVCNSFGYFMECIRSYELPATAKSAPELDMAVLCADKELSIALILPYLCDVAHMNLASLMYIRDTKSDGAPDWLRQYCQWFGIPKDDTYFTGWSPGSRQYGGQSFLLQFDALIAGIHAFMRPGRREVADPATHCSRRLLDLHEEYQQRLRMLEDGDALSLGDLDLRTSMGLDDNKQDHNRFVERWGEWTIKR